MERDYTIILSGVHYEKRDGQWVDAEGCIVPTSLVPELEKEASSQYPDYSMPRKGADRKKPEKRVRRKADRKAGTKARSKPARKRGLYPISGTRRDPITGYWSELAAIAEGCKAGRSLSYIRKEIGLGYADTQRLAQRAVKEHLITVREYKAALPKETTRKQAR